MARKNGFNSGSEYTVSYGGFRGVDRNASNTEISPSRLAYSENMYRDYDADSSGAIESIPGFRKLYGFGEAIHGIFSQRCKGGEDHLLVHAGTSLYRFPVSERDLIEDLVPIGTLADRRSRGFALKDNFFILDGDGLYRIDEEGVFTSVKEDLDDIYIPTTYVNGEEFEQRNLLTDRFYEEYLVSDPYAYSYGTPALRYTVTDSDLLHCAVSGIDGEYRGEVYVPRYVDLSGVRYTVTEIKDSAFDKNVYVSSVRIAEGVERIGKNAFRSSGINSAVMPSSVKEIGTAAFSECSYLKEFYLGIGTEILGSSLFEKTESLSEIHYEGGEDDFELIGNTEVLSGKTVIYNSSDKTVRIELPISSSASCVDMIRIDDRPISSDPIYSNSRVSSVIIPLDGEWSIRGKRVKLGGTLTPYLSDFSGKSSSFLDTKDGGAVGGFSAVTQCRIAESFDGRIFLAGNPSLPNTVFFSERDRTGENNPLYFGAMNYFNDGTGGYETVSMLSVRDALAVFKSGDDGSGSIFYHVARETGDSVVPKAYPVSYIHSGISAKGEAFSFLDDAVFLSPLGLSALEHKSVNYERSIGCRSHNVNRDLLAEDLSKASLCFWRGYLVVGVNGRMYLADSRAKFIHETQNTEYEWFICKDIGTYVLDRRTYVYSSVAPPGFSVHKDADRRCYSTVYSVVNGSRAIYYVPEGGVNYRVHPTDEWAGGELVPAKIFFSDGELLFFGTDMGDLCVFNNDKRGVAPDRIALGIDFDEDEYRRDMGNRLHPDFYAFVNHAPRYAISTKLDNCGIPHLSKNTVKHSLVVKSKSYGRAGLHLEVSTDKSGSREVCTFSSGEMDLSDIDFTNVSFEGTESYSLPFIEKEKGWIEKQLTLYSDTFRSPIEIYSLSYRYRIKGNIERR